MINLWLKKSTKITENNALNILSDKNIIKSVVTIVPKCGKDFCGSIKYLTTGNGEITIVIKNSYGITKEYKLHRIKEIII